MSVFQTCELKFQSASHYNRYSAFHPHFISSSSSHPPRIIFIIIPLEEKSEKREVRRATTLDSWSLRCFLLQPPVGSGRPRLILWVALTVPQSYSVLLRAVSLSISTLPEGWLCKKRKTSPRWMSNGLEEAARRGKRSKAKSTRNFSAETEVDHPVPHGISGTDRNRFRNCRLYDALFLGRPNFSSEKGWEKIIFPPARHV